MTVNSSGFRFRRFAPRKASGRSPMAMAAVGVLGILVGIGPGCGPKPVESVGDGGGGRGGGGGGGRGGGGGSGGGGGGPCVNLQCKQQPCPGGGDTTLSGTVYSPAGDLPIYNAIVYVPNSPVSPFQSGAFCNRCDSPLTGNPVVVASTNEEGKFVLKNVPVSDNLPLVVQVGKWRRQVTIPSVRACSDTPVDAGMTRLPRNKGEGDIPLIALTTGGADALECLLRKLGVEDPEFTNGTGDGRIHLFSGSGGANRFAANLNNGAMFSSATQFWATTPNLMKYDVVVLSCEGAQNLNTKPVAARQAMADYANMGGRVFASHWHNVWIEQGPDPWPNMATEHSNPQLPDLMSPFVAEIDTSFPRGFSLDRWLQAVGGSTQGPGRLEILAAQHSVSAVINARRWVYSDATTPTSVQYFSFNVPYNPDPDAMPCGRVVFSDIHVASGDVSNTSNRFPAGCRPTALLPQEKALIFMLFDLSSCVIDDGRCPNGAVRCGAGTACPGGTVCVSGCCIIY